MTSPTAADTHPLASRDPEPSIASRVVLPTIAAVSGLAAVITGILGVIVLGH